MTGQDQTPGDAGAEPTDDAKPTDAKLAARQAARQAAVRRLVAAILNNPGGGAAWK
jgi:hypothetical protein